MLRPLGGVESGSCASMRSHSVHLLLDLDDMYHASCKIASQPQAIFKPMRLNMDMWRASMPLMPSDLHDTLSSFPRVHSVDVPSVNVLWDWSVACMLVF